MRILQVNKLYPPWIGGIEKVVQQISEGLNKKDNLDIEVLCCQAKGKKKIEEINKVKIWRAASFGIFFSMPLSLDFFKLFKNLIKKADLIDLHLPFPLANLAFFLFRPKTSLIIHYHSDIVKQKFFAFLLRPIVLHTLKSAKKIIVSNPNLIKNSVLLKQFEEKCVVIPFGVDSNKFQITSEQEKKIQDIKNKYGKFILFVGRLIYYKGVKYLIKAIKNMDANLVIIGQGPLASKLKVKSQKLKVESKIFFTSKLEEGNLINFFHACELFVLPSIYQTEAFGIVLIEAMACGKPIISTELGTGTSWVNQNGITGFVVQPKNSHELSSAIQKIINNKKLAEIMGKNAHERANEVFNLNKMLESTKKLYLET
ncbi:glycosyltransferase [Patescibacteria group bacterium]|nr:glycosyltransferase [Patescibacteria group bacterium]MBU1991514.1 glycosyltransferase [Patescibacteria group bacterium]